MSDRVLLSQTGDDAATVCFWSDRVAATIVERTAKTIKVRSDDAVLLNGGDSGEADALTFHVGGFAAIVEGTQRYAYYTDEGGQEYEFSLRKSGRWVRKGQADKHGSTRLIVGKRSQYHDYGF